MSYLMARFFTRSFSRMNKNKQKMDQSLAILLNLVKQTVYINLNIMLSNNIYRLFESSIIRIKMKSNLTDENVNVGI